MVELASPFRANQTLDDFKQQCLTIIKGSMANINNNSSQQTDNVLMATDGSDSANNTINEPNNSEALELDFKIIVRFHNERKAFKIKDEEDWHHVVERVAKEPQHEETIKLVECKARLKKSNNKHHKKRVVLSEGMENARENRKLSKKLKREERLKHTIEDILGKRVMKLDITGQDEDDDKEQQEEKYEKKRVKRETAAQAKNDDVPLVGEHGEGLTLPANISRIFLDGNNMFFMTQTMRDLLLKKKNKKEAEQLIIEIASRFSRASEALWNRPLNMHVCFDAANPQVMRGDIENDTFVVSSASNAGFSTADDMLVELANRQNIAGHLDSCLFVTSDNGLRQRLKEIGAKVAKSGKWMKCCYAHLCSDTTQFSMNDWMRHIVEDGSLNMD
ncbi:hypothetical protein C9374_000910 [Naegleria lovaniensis]|uniref:NYN domain-containing protein n=1 Tax=Naegleria lovaniensis TaxID=51637 RepID=A0AA88KLN5_NAELO|nr:uncharacterized protein C9374_000910 [Naegleria lovaniensis]KAG2388060.1 hypothetical protein C9374_000910 [Naegleria lovaniensis]